MSPNLALQRGVPADVDAERFVLGSIMLNEALFVTLRDLRSTPDGEATRSAP
jgi:hypothetical protein